MKKQFSEKTNIQQGSATVEAVVAFLGFLFTIFTILGMVNFCRVQMRVSAAVDATAKELSQYAYFYEMSGLQKFDKAVKEKGGVGKNNVNEIISSVDTLYSTLGKATKQTSEDAANLANATSRGEVDLSAIENGVANIQDNAKEIETSVASVANAFERIGDDPLLYMRSLVAIIGSEGADQLKKAIAVPLAKSMMKKHFGSTDSEVLSTLESLGIEGGLENMNFSMSSLFADGDCEDVEIVVFYKVKLFQIFNMDFLEADVSKRALCRAWLGGDNVQAVVKVESSESTAEGETTGGEGSTTEATKEETPETTTEATVETTVETTVSSVDITGSFWHLGDGGYEVKNAGVEEAFHDKFCNDYGIPKNDLMGYKKESVAEGEPVKNIYGYDLAYDVESSMLDITSVLSHRLDIQDFIKRGYLPDTVESLTYVIYVPENIPPEDEEELNRLIEEAKTFSTDKSGEDLADVAVDIVIEKAGGNYDYESGVLE